MKQRIMPILASAVLIGGIATIGASAALENPSEFDYGRFKDDKITLNVANWGEYMSVNDPEALDVNKEFEEISGINVNYQTYATNEELYAKLKSGGADYDIIIPSDYMVSRMIKEEMLFPLDFANIPNIKLINKKYISPSYDPTNEYSVPYMGGIVCIIYNKTMITDTVDSWSALWDERYKGQILMFNNPRDAFGIALIKEGYSQNSENKDELRRAADSLKEQKKVVQAYVMDEIFDKLEGGSAAIAPYYAGDAVTMMAENSDLAYAIPKEGTNQFVDAICIPTRAKNRAAAEMYANFLNEPEVALANAEVIGYSTPNDATFALLPEEIQNNPLQYPDEVYLETKTEFFNNLTDETNAYVQTLWNEIKVKSASSSSWLVPTLILLAVAVIAIIALNVRRYKKKQDIF